MGSADPLRALARARLSDEIGTLAKQAPERVALVYPSPYSVAMSSLGFQQIYRTTNATPGRSAERAFLPEDVEAHRGVPLFTYESMRPVSDFAVIGLSVAFELELAGVVRVLELAGLEPLAEDRREGDPFVLAGGPLTFSNPLPLAPYADAILMGEADETAQRALDVIFGCATKEEAKRALAREIPPASCRICTRSCPRWPSAPTRSCRPTRPSARRTPSSRTCSSSRRSAAATGSAPTA
ncbi:MAG: hypothetical protein M5U28_35260 [Sandaracinaceae bacterium]|nr:hypothetical protein [Sandaracinaceae bacterium]